MAHAVPGCIALQHQRAAAMIHLQTFLIEIGSLDAIGPAYHDFVGALHPAATVIK